MTGLPRKACVSCVWAVALLITGCSGPAMYSFNGVPFPDPITATAAMEAYYSGIENSIVAANKQIPASLLIVVPSRQYARSHWIRITGNRAAIGEEQLQYLANSQVRDSLSVARCIEKSQIFKSVNIVHALPGTLEPPPTEAVHQADYVMKRLPSGQWGVGPAPLGPCVPIIAPSGLQGAAVMNALILATQNQVTAMKAPERTLRQNSSPRQRAV